MKDWKCEWDKDCPNKAIKMLWRFDYSRPPYMGDSFGAGKAPPPTYHTEYVKVCEAHYSEARISFPSEVSGWGKPLEKNQKEPNQYIEPPKPVGPKKCPLCQTIYQDWALNYCLND